MRLPSSSKAFSIAKKTGKKAMILYLANPQDENVKETMYECFLTTEDYDKVKALLNELLMSKKKNPSMVSLTY